AGRFAELPDDERYRTVRGWQRLGARELAVLRELAAWRERSAARANIRPNFIANDIVLTSLAARPVTSIEELKQMRGLTAGTVDRHGKGILAALRAGLACPPERSPEPPARHRHKGPPPGLVALLRAAVQAVAARDDVVVARGWRRALVGQTLLAIARGELAMRYDAGRREVVAEAVPRGSL